MPAEDVTITGSFTANENTAYKVEHYQQNLNDDAYTLKDTETLKGTTDTTATATPKTYEGFTFDGSVKGTVQSGTITGDGKLVLKLYYTRNSYKVSYVYEGTRPTGASALPAEATYKYGAEVTVAEAATAPGYTFSGWSGEGKFNMPAENVTITGSFAANGDTKYAVEYYLEDLDGKGYTKDTEASYTAQGQTDTEVTAQEKAFTGFTFDEKAEGTKVSGTIVGDGSLVLKLYYTRNSYKVSYTYEGTRPTGASALPVEATYKYGAEVKVAEAATAPGYTFSGWNPSKDFAMPAEDVTITGSFVANEDTKYVVEFYYQNEETGVYELEGEPKVYNGVTDTTVSVSETDKTPKKDAEHYYFDESIEGTELEGNVAGDESLVLKVYFSLQYKVIGKINNGGIVTNANQIVKYADDSVPMEFVAASGFVIKSISIDGDEQKVELDQTTYTYPTQENVKDDIEVVVETISMNDHLTLVKTTTSDAGTDAVYGLGEKIDYEIRIVNDGNITINNVVVKDILENASGHVTWDESIQVDNNNYAVVGTMKPGESKTLQCSYIVLEEDLGKILGNVATADGESTDKQDPEPEVIPGETEDGTEDPKPDFTSSKALINKGTGKDGKATQ